MWCRWACAGRSAPGRSKANPKASEFFLGLFGHPGGATHLLRMPPHQDGAKRVIFVFSDIIIAEMYYKSIEMKRRRCAGLFLFTSALLLPNVLDLTLAQNALTDDAAAQFQEMRKNVRSGILENGFRYALASTRDVYGIKSDGAIYVDLAVEAGYADVPRNLVELPHILEHVLTRGFKTADAKYLTIDDLQRQHGITVSIAVTGPFWTSFRFRVPQSEVRHGLALVRNIAHGANLYTDDISIEANIVGTEALWNAASSRSAIGIARTNFGSPENLHTQDDRYRSAKETNPRDVLDFYHRWYRANKEILYVSGDFDVDSIENAIRNSFSSIPHGGPVSKGKQKFFDLSKGPVIENAQQRTTISTLLLGYSLARKRSTIGKREASIQRVVASLLDDKLGGRKKKFGSPVLRAKIVSSDSDKFDQLGRVNIRFSSPLGKFENAVSEIAATLNNLAYGLTIEELKKAKEDATKFMPDSRFKNCLDPIGLLSGLQIAKQAGMFGDLYCQQGINKADINAVAMAEVRDELRRLLDMRRIGFFAVTRKGDENVGLANLRKAFATTNPNTIGATKVQGGVFCEPAAFASICEHAELLRDLEQGQVIHGPGAIRPKIYFQQNNEREGFALSAYGIAARDLPPEKRGVLRRLQGLARLSGIGGLNGRALAQYLELNGLRYDVELTASHSVIRISGPVDKLNEGLILLYHGLRGPHTDDETRREVEWGELSVEMDDGAVARALFDRSFQLNLRPPLSWTEANLIDQMTVSDTDVRSVWADLFNPNKLAIVVTGAERDPVAVDKFRVMPFKFAEPLDKPTIAHRETRLFEGGGKHFTLRRGYGLEADIRVVVPLKVPIGIDARAVERALPNAISEKWGRFYHRIRVIEGGAYSPITNVLLDPYRADNLYLVIEFVCAPESTSRLIEAVWEEIAIIQRQGFSPEEVLAMRDMQPIAVDPAEKQVFPLSNALGSKASVTSSRTIQPPSIDQILAVVRTAKRDDITVFEVRP